MKRKKKEKEECKKRIKEWCKMKINDIKHYLIVKHNSIFFNLFLLKNLQYIIKTCSFLIYYLIIFIYNLLKENKSSYWIWLSSLLLLLNDYYSLFIYKQIIEIIIIPPHYFIFCLFLINKLIRINLIIMIIFTIPSFSSSIFKDE